MLWKMAPRLALFLRDGPSTALLAAMQEGFARLPGNKANAIFEAKADLETSSTRKFKRKMGCNTRSRNMADEISEAFKLVQT